MATIAANGAFDVLLVGYVSRWQRNLAIRPPSMSTWWARSWSVCQRARAQSEPGGGDRHDPSAALLLELRAGAFELVTSPMLLAELAEVLGRPKFRPYVTAAKVAVYVELIGHEATIHYDPPPADEPLSGDSDDEYLLGLASAAAADALVSGDSHLLVLRDIVPVMTPAEFLASLGNR